MSIFKFLPLSTKLKIYNLYRDKILKPYFPKKIIEPLYLQRVGKPINWEHPESINEIHQILKLKCDLDEWALLADKYRVREFVASKGLGHTLTTLYGVYDSAADIDFDVLPDSFVIRTNNRSGDIVLVKDKNTMDLEALREKYAKIMHTPFGDTLYEPHYNRIKPKIVVEEFLDIDSQPMVSTSLVDYKIWCFYGKPYCIEVYYNRTEVYEETSVYTTSWEPIPYAVKTTSHYHYSDKKIPKPEKLDEMLKYASLLSRDIPVARVDFYYTGGKIYFGEMTLTPSGGFQHSLSDRFLNELGAQADLDRINKTHRHS